jgi:hypothetical protein
MGNLSFHCRKWLFPDAAQQHIDLGAEHGFHLVLEGAPKAARSSG